MNFSYDSYQAIVDAVLAEITHQATIAARRRNHNGTTYRHEIEADGFARSAFQYAQEVCTSEGISPEGFKAAYQAILTAFPLVVPQAIEHLQRETVKPPKKDNRDMKKKPRKTAICEICWVEGRPTDYLFCRTCKALSCPDCLPRGIDTMCVACEEDPRRRPV
jgi:hypothetical protein